MKTHLSAYTLCFALFALAQTRAAPTDGLVQYSDTFTVQKPYDLNISDRFSVTDVGGILQYNCWINHGDHPLYPGSPTAPRTEMRWNTNWTTTERMWEADVMIDPGSDGTAIQQIKSNSGFEPIYINVHNNGNLYNDGGSTVLASNITGKWFHLLCAYNPQTGIGRAWINGTLVVTRSDPHPLSTVWYFKNGTYGTKGTSRTHYQNVKFWCHDQSTQVQSPSYRPLDATYPNTQLVTIYSPTSGVSIRYTTDGSTPSATSGTLYTGPVELGTGKTTIKAVAYKAGLTTSSVTFSNFNITGSTPQVSAPVFSSDTGVYGSSPSVSMSLVTSGALIRYTTDGSIPTETVGTLYSNVPVTIGAGATTLQAIAYKSGQVDSKVTYAFYLVNGSQVADPTFTPAGGAYTSAQTVTIASATGGVSIRYTTDGSTPSETVGTIYSGAITINTTTTVNAMAYKAGANDSNVTSATYTFGSPVTLNFEAESLSPVGTGATVSTSSDANASGGTLEFLNATAAGQTIAFTTPSIPAGTYQVQLRYKTNTTRGQHTVKIDGTQVGGTIDQYAKTAAYPTATLGNVTFASAGTHSIVLTVTGKNSAATQFYITADKFTFVGQ